MWEDIKKALGFTDEGMAAHFVKSKPLPGGHRSADYCQGWRDAMDKVEDIAAEFGDDPEQALGIIGEHAHGQQEIER